METDERVLTLGGDRVSGEGGGGCSFDSEPFEDLRSELYGHGAGDTPLGSLPPEALQKELDAVPASHPKA